MTEKFESEILTEITNELSAEDRININLNTLMSETLANVLIDKSSIYDDFIKIISANACIAHYQLFLNHSESILSDELKRRIKIDIKLLFSQINTRCANLKKICELFKITDEEMKKKLDDRRNENVD